jgi:hypothetical protein
MAVQQTSDLVKLRAVIVTGLRLFASHGRIQGCTRFKVHFGRYRYISPSILGSFSDLFSHSGIRFCRNWLKMASVLAGNFLDSCISLIRGGSRSYLF